MHYLIDGYNLMFRVLKAGDDLQKQRERIIHDLNAKIQFLGLDATLVFDAQYQFGAAQRTHYKQVEILFTAEGETADDYILHELKSSQHPAGYTVVTSDKKLAWLSRRRLAHTEEVDEFLGWLNKRYKNKLRRLKEAREAPVPPKPAKKQPPVVPIPTSPEECFNYYLQQFEERFQKIAKKVPEKKEAKAKPRATSYKKQVRPPKKTKADDQSDMDRWLQAFSKEPENN